MCFCHRPAVVQNECHPYLPAREVRAICRENGIVFQVYAFCKMNFIFGFLSISNWNLGNTFIKCKQAYASLGAGLLPLLQDPTITSIAARLAVTPGQVEIWQDNACLNLISCSFVNEHCPTAPKWDPIWGPFGIFRFPKGPHFCSRYKLCRLTIIILKIRLAIPII